ncbi:hypothetical protein CMQ_1637 [Grosmannia clavigera kw1407]|uniref:Uncharacterized protein n=1 Tax=Grosmannia clavigera (strain kw1407 / UAMH 11150) TaxID=655863 RepID=F0XFP7_GROCL|nr:uncharacterized protein CMQ_1637 [Grosmannia clavigera kw1407]EFX04709.1 hypothetical protein CMQ_1637 [Grosmannia clavigera kw1407]
MSPIARAAMRSARIPLNSFSRTAPSMITRRLASTTKSAPPDYGRLAKHAVTNLVVYVPTAAVILGWPYVCYKIFEDRM